MRCSVVFGVTLRLLVINISSSSPAINTAAYYQRCVITCETVAVVHQRPRWQHLACCSVNTSSQARYRLRIAISAYPACIQRPRYGGSRRSIATLLGTEKLEWYGCPIAKKFRRYLYSFWHNSRTWPTHGHTHTETPYDGIGRAYASKKRAARRHGRVRHINHTVRFQKSNPPP